MEAKVSKSHQIHIKISNHIQSPFRKSYFEVAV